MNTKEAIERVKVRFDKWALDEKDLAALQALGLVDTESEDEKIRKELIDFVSDIKRIAESGRAAALRDEDIELCEQFLDYLERQKEQNLEDIEDKAVRKYMKLDKFALANMLAERDKTNAEVIEAFESIEEQPAEWSKEDKSILNNIIAYKYLNIDDLEWLKSLPERFNLQPKQKWSEEDKSTLNRIVEVLVECSYVQNWWKKGRLISKEEMEKLVDFLKFKFSCSQPENK